MSPKVVSEQLRHASTAFTLDTYAHVLPHMQDEAEDLTDQVAGYRFSFEFDKKRKCDHESSHLAFFRSSANWGINKKTASIVVDH